MVKIISVVGARPNFMKIAPFIRAIEKHNAGLPLQDPKQVQHLLVHTGQHYDDRMSRSFFESLNIPDADINLGIGSGSHAEQVGKTMIEFEKVLKQEKPDWVVVVGDVNATLACSVTAKKELIKVCHIEAGLRSGDMSMPEEINRLVTDRLSDLLLTPDLISSANLEKEGVPAHKIRFTGNIMIDTLEANREKAATLNVTEIIKNNLIENKSTQIKVEENNFAVVTLHRPSNVDHKEIFTELCRFLSNEVAQTLPILWPIHPRTLKNMESFGILDMMQKNQNIYLLQALGYFDMLRLNIGARLMLTDSGGLQEECTVLGTPCLTMRWNTERPVTLKEHGGASILVGNNIKRIREEYLKILHSARMPVRPELWDGKTAERCLTEILNSGTK